MLNKNDIVKLNIEDITNEGNGVGRIDNMVVFVPYTCVGDEINARIVKVKKSYSYGIIESYIKKSDRRCDLDCESFQKCGGCAFRHFSYEEELRVKQSFVKASFERLGKLSVEFEEPLGCDNTLNYRNKAQYPVAEENGNLISGFYSKRSHRVVSNKNCLLQPELFNKIADDIIDMANTLKISAYNEMTNKGILRHLFIRSGYHTGEVMVCFVVTRQDDRFEEIANTLVNKYKEIKTILININSKKTNVILGDRNITLIGTGKITDIICGNKISISPHSFYQINTSQAEKLYEKAKEYADLNPNDTLLDLYCGVGTIGLSMARDVKKLIGVEVIDKAIEDANENAKLNGIENAEFICGDAGEVADKLINRGEQPDVIIADPARKGCDKLSLDSMIKMSPKKIVMISCNHSTCARDLRYLCDNGYEIKKAKVVDMFPRTTHVECVCLMTRKEK